MADGLFYVDSRPPFLSADPAAVTLASTAKALVPIANLPVLGANYFSFIGKAIRIRLFGRLTTAATPGNGTLSLYWGTGADANGTVVGTTAAFALTASQSNMSWECILIARCRAMGATGSLFVTGEFNANVAVVASTLQPVLMPANTPAAVTVDLTAANYLSPQFARSGSTAESIQVHDVQIEALN